MKTWCCIFFCDHRVVSSVARFRAQRSRSAGALAIMLLTAASVAAPPPPKQPPPATVYEPMQSRQAPSHGATGATGNKDGGTGPTDPTQVIVYHPPVGVPCDFGAGGFSGGRGASEARAAQLDKDGPQLPRVFSMSAFSVMGFVKGSWPVVFDYQLERDSLLIAVIAPEGQEPILFRLNGKAGHWQNRLAVPARVGGNPVVAQYVLRSLDDGVGQMGPAHLHVHGIAAGFKAVGSIGIDQVDFSPATIHPEHGEKAHYMFHSISDFKNVEVNFVRIANDHGQIIAARIGKKTEGSITKNERKNGDWDGSTDGGGKEADVYSAEIKKWLRSTTGQHLLQVRAWYGAKDGDWATALSENFVDVE